MWGKVGGDPNWSEAKIVLRSVYDVNFPKFTVEDLAAVQGYHLGSFPPKLTCLSLTTGPLLECIDEQCRKVTPT